MKYGKTGQHSQAKTRKEKRKEERLHKKRNKLLHYRRQSNQDDAFAGSVGEATSISHKLPKNKAVDFPQKKVKQAAKRAARSVPSEEEEEHEDDKLIRMYSKKLGGDRRVSKQLLGDGFDSDLFSFLDNISQKVRAPNRVSAPTQQSKKKRKSRQVAESGQNPPMEQQPAIESEVQAAEPETKPQESREVLLARSRKSLNGLLNRISEGNLAKVFRQVHDILQGSPKPQIYDVLADLFVKFNIHSLRVMLNILATQTALICALHHLHGNEMFGRLVKQVVSSYLASYELNDPQEKLEQQKNAINVLSYMYLFGSITVFFIRELIQELVEEVDGTKVELLFLLISTVGSRIRSDDPTVLKEIIEVVKKKFEAARNTTLQNNKKAGYIIEDLDELRFNRKSEASNDRLQFLHTFVKKEVLQRNNLQPVVLLWTFKDITKGQTDDANVEVEPDSDAEEPQQIGTQLKAKKRYYQELAKDQKMVTEFRKKVFVALITAEDYIEGAEKILDFRSKKLNEIASVIVETCTQETAFNLYYPLVAAKLVEVVPRFRPAIQFMIWNQVKQLSSFSLRKICNLAKFLSRLILHSASCSLSMLKNFSDLSAVDKHEQIFITAFFEDFFTEVSTTQLNELIRKVREGDNNKDFKAVLEQFLEQDFREYCKTTKKSYLDKVKLAVRFLKLSDTEVR